MSADNRQTLVQRDERLAVSTRLRVIRPEELSDKRTDQL